MTPEAPAAPPAEATESPESQSQEQAQQPAEVASAKPAEATPAEPSWLNEKTKLKIKGAERELTVKEALQLAQKAGGAEVTMQEAAMLRKAVAQALSELDKDPLHYARKKLTPEQYRERLENELYDFIQRDMMDPKDRQIQELQSRLEVTEKEREEQEKSVREQQIQQMAEKYRADVEAKLVKAMEGSGLPKHPIVFKMAANYLKMVADWNHKLARERHGGDTKSAKRDPQWITLEPDDPRLIKQVRTDFDDWFKTMFSASDGDQLLQFLGPEITEKIRKAEISKLGAQGVKMPDVAKSVPGGQPGGKRRKKVSIREWRENNKKIMADL